MADFAVSVAPATTPVERAAMMAFATISGVMATAAILPQTMEERPRSAHPLPPGLSCVGKVKQNLLPVPGADTTQSFPRCASISIFEI
jgi:hypothetical protein